MTQKSPYPAHFRMISNSARGITHSAEGHPPERHPPFSRMSTSKKANYCQTVKLHHLRAGIRNEDAAIKDFLRDMGQSHTPPVTLILFWILSLLSNHSINAITSIQQEAVYRYRLEECALSHHSRKNEALNPRGDHSLVSPSSIWFYFTLSTVAVNLRANRAAQVRCSSAVKDIAPLSVSSTFWPPPARSVLPASIIPLLFVFPGCDPACSPFFPFVSESPLLIALPSHRFPSAAVVGSISPTSETLLAGINHCSGNALRNSHNITILSTPVYSDTVSTYSPNRKIHSPMARNEDCLHCADLQAEMDELRTQQSLLDRKQNLLDARLEEHDRRLDEQNRRIFEQDSINTEKYKAEIQLFMHKVASLEEQFRQLTNRCGHVEESISILQYMMEKITKRADTSSSSVKQEAKDENPEESTARQIQHIMID